MVQKSQNVGVGVGGELLILSNNLNIQSENICYNRHWHRVTLAPKLLFMIVYKALGSWKLGREIYGMCLYSYNGLTFNAFERIKRCWAKLTCCCVTTSLGTTTLTSSLKTQSCIFWGMISANCVILKKKNAKVSFFLGIDCWIFLFIMTTTVV